MKPLKNNKAYNLLHNANKFLVATCCLWVIYEFAMLYYKDIPINPMSYIILTSNIMFLAVLEVTLFWIKKIKKINK